MLIKDFDSYQHRARGDLENDAITHLLSRSPTNQVSLIAFSCIILWPIERIFVCIIETRNLKQAQYRHRFTPFNPFNTFHLSTSITSTDTGTRVQDGIVYRAVTRLEPARLGHAIPTSWSISAHGGTRWRSSYFFDRLYFAGRKSDQSCTSSILRSYSRPGVSDTCSALNLVSKVLGPGFQLQRNE